MNVHHDHEGPPLLLADPTLNAAGVAWLDQANYTFGLVSDVLPDPIGHSTNPKKRNRDPFDSAASLGVTLTKSKRPKKTSVEQSKRVNTDKLESTCFDSAQFIGCSSPTEVQKVLRNLTLFAEPGSRFLIHCAYGGLKNVRAVLDILKFPWEKNKYKGDLHGYLHTTPLEKPGVPVLNPHTNLVETYVEHKWYECRNPGCDAGRCAAKIRLYVTATAPVLYFRIAVLEKHSCDAVEQERFNFPPAQRIMLQQPEEPLLQLLPRQSADWSSDEETCADTPIPSSSPLSSEPTSPGPHSSPLQADSMQFGHNASLDELNEHASVFRSLTLLNPRTGNPFLVVGHDHDPVSTQHQVQFAASMMDVDIACERDVFAPPDVLDHSLSISEFDLIQSAISELQPQPSSLLTGVSDIHDLLVPTSASLEELYPLPSPLFHDPLEANYLTEFM